MPRYTPSELVEPCRRDGDAPSVVSEVMVRADATGVPLPLDASAHTIDASSLFLPGFRSSVLSLLPFRDRARRRPNDDRYRHCLA